MLCSSSFCCPFPARRAVNIFKPATLAIALLLVRQALLMAGESEEGPQSSGTGFIVSRQGHIVTNHHVGCMRLSSSHLWS
jgi:S1-C subfamily serine protease